MQMTYLYASDFSFKNFRKIAAQYAEIIRKMFGKELWRVLVVDKSTDHDKPHFDLFSATEKRTKANVVATTAKHPHSDSQISRYGGNINFRQTGIRAAPHRHLACAPLSRNI